MSLAERRIQNEFDTETLPSELKKLSEQTNSATAQLKYIIEWESFPGIEALENLKDFYSQPLFALYEVGKDDLGLQALKKLKKIVYRNVTSNEQVKAEYTNGTLTISMNTAAGVDKGSLGWPNIKNVLENGL